jgi:hypothetical protein
VACGGEATKGRLMSDLLPALSRTLEIQQGVRAQRRAEAMVLRHGLAARVQAEVDQIDSQALGDALKASLDEEVGLLDYGMRLANGNQAAAELAARKVGMQSAVNNQRIMRRFGR